MYICDPDCKNQSRWGKMTLWVFFIFSKNIIPRVSCESFAWFGWVVPFLWDFSLDTQFLRFRFVTIKDTCNRLTLINETNILLYLIDWRDHAVKMTFFKIITFFFYLSLTAFFSILTSPHLDWYLQSTSHIRYVVYSCAIWLIYAVCNSQVSSTCNDSLEDAMSWI